uniref:RNA helicase n=1 Tax=Polytomella parva TaxID=51329 RepID=A0A7S0YFI4_9CHLO|mmetsp:Transcript_24143/g.43205  ORF Transcript_24143/g.43205 Transcript_24143/m.43205 type:complete len:588 (+) Transcript_24143:70-1833(+)
MAAVTDVENEAKINKLNKKLKKIPKRVSNGEITEAEAAIETAEIEKKLKKLAPAPRDESVKANGDNKKKKKREEDEPSSVSSDKAVVKDDAPSSKKPKKEKKERDFAVGGGNTLAEVGDKTLIASSKPLIKKLYTEHPDVARLSAAEVAKLRADLVTVVDGEGAADVKPITKFEHTGLSASMLHSTRTFTSPSPVQAQCWPIMLGGRDLIGIAATGSGKTLGFGLPIIRHIIAQREAGVVKGKGPFAIVLAPTRELALQIHEVLHEAGSQCQVRAVCIYGGVPKKDQTDALRRGVEIVVGTPGRVEDLMTEGALVMEQVTFAVLDEADRMLDLGFEPHIRAIVGRVRADRQTAMFSATWPTAVQKMAAAFLCNAVKVTIGSQDLAASHTITQHVEVIEPHARDSRLLQLLQKYHSSRKNRVIIFVLYKKEAPRVESLLQRNNWKAAAIHGDMTQVARTQAVEQFKEGKIPLLIATDVAARGLDIPDVEIVINYSFPLTTEDYVHRIGRTGRAGKTGIAHTFFCAGADKPRAGELINVLREAKQEVPESLLSFGTTVKKKESKLYGAHFKDVDINAKASKMTFDSDDE